MTMTATKIGLAPRSSLKPGSPDSSMITSMVPPGLAPRIRNWAAEENANDHPQRHRRRGARVDWHAIPASGFAQGRGLRLPGVCARGLARALWRGAGVGAALFAGLGRGGK